MGFCDNRLFYKLERNFLSLKSYSLSCSFMSLRILQGFPTATTSLGISFVTLCLIVLLRNQKSSERCPLRYLPIVPALPKRARRLGCGQRTDFMHARHSLDMRKEFKRGTPSSFCPFRTFRTGEKYLYLWLLLAIQKYVKT